MVCFYLGEVRLDEVRRPRTRDTRSSRPLPGNRQGNRQCSRCTFPKLGAAHCSTFELLRAASAEWARPHRYCEGDRPVAHRSLHVDDVLYQYLMDQSIR